MFSFSHYTQITTFKNFTISFLGLYYPIFFASIDIYKIQGGARVGLQL